MEGAVLALDDPRWKQLKGGYRIPYDASVALRRLEQGDDVWDQLCQELHHQGDLGDASYAAVPQLVRIMAPLPARDWNFYGLVSTIEIERHRKSNPPVPDWLADDYFAALRRVLEIALTDLRNVQDKTTVQSILGAVALVKGSLKLGAMIARADDSEIDAVLEQYDAWSQLYR